MYIMTMLHANVFKGEASTSVWLYHAIIFLLIKYIFLRSSPMLSKICNSGYWLDVYSCLLSSFFLNGNRRGYTSNSTLDDNDLSF